LPPPIDPMTEEDDMVTLQDEETRVRELLAPLQWVESVPLPEGSPERRPLKRRPAFAAGFAAAVFVVATGVAFANDVNPFTRIAAFVGLTAANRAQTSQDALDPAIVAQLDSAEEYTSRGKRPLDPGPPRGEIVTDSIRFLRELPSGRNLYLARTTTEQLIVILTEDGKLASAFGVPPLPTRDPVTEASIDDEMHPARGAPGLFFGIAQDGVTAVSFINEDGGTEQTVPVIDNVWAFEGSVWPQWTITAHYADGTRSRAHRGGPCVVPFPTDTSLGPIWCASAPTFFWFPTPGPSGGNTNTTTPWSVAYYDPEDRG
jgi:hypothetical protein